MKICRILLIAVSLWMAGSLWAVSVHSANYTLHSSVFGSGGKCESSKYLIHTVIGEPVSGRAFNSNYEIFIGFLYTIVDTDGDGLPDDLEDLNHNGLIDPGETDPLNPDSDNDGMPDGWEVQYGLNPLVDDADEDLDGDKFSNLKEYQHGSIPNDPHSRPKIALPWLLLLLGEVRTDFFSGHVLSA